MEQYDHIGARLDRLPLARFHFRIFGIISFSLLLTGFLSYSGNVVLAKLVSNGWSNNFLNAAFTSALMFGYFIGSLTGGFIGDYLGRRKAVRLFCLGGLCSGAVADTFTLARVRICECGRAHCGSIYTVWRGGITDTIRFDHRIYCAGRYAGSLRANPVFLWY